MKTIHGSYLRAVGTPAIARGLSMASRNEDESPCIRGWQSHHHLIWTKTDAVVV